MTTAVSSNVTANQISISTRQALLILCLFLTFNSLLLWTPKVVEAALGSRIMPLVEIGEASVGGQTRAQAFHRLTANQSKTLSKPINIRLGGIIRSTTFLSLGVVEDIASEVDQAFQVGRDRSILTDRQVPTQYLIHQEKLTIALQDLFGEIDKPPEPAHISVDNGSATISPSQAGFGLDGQAVEQTIIAAAKEGNDTIELSFESIETEITVDKLTIVKQQADRWLDKRVEIKIDDHVGSVPRETIGQWIEFIQSEGGSVAKLNHDRVKEYIAGLAKGYDRQAKPAIVYEDGEIVQEGSTGRQLNQSQLLDEIFNLFESDRSSIVVANFSEVSPKTQTKIRGYLAGRIGGKYIEINLSEQIMYTFEGDSMIGSYRVSTGQWSMPTPEGEFEINSQIDVAYSKRYNLYMPKWMAFIGSKYGIHGLPYWASGVVEGEDHLGKPVSHGCIRLSHTDADTVYSWAEVGTKVYIHK